MLLDTSFLSGQKTKMNQEVRNMKQFKTKECKHGRIVLLPDTDPETGLLIQTSYCPDCKQKWFDDGRRWNKSFST